MLDVVTRYLESGLSLFPAHPVLKNPRIETWKPYQKDQPSLAELASWFTDSFSSPAIVTGKVSGNVEMLDFDEKGRQFPLWKELVQEQSPGLVDKLPQQTTQNGGVHVIYRCADVEIPGAKKLSMGAISVDGPGEHLHDGKGYKAIEYRGQWIISPTLIETRGEGGYFLASPGKGYKVINGTLVSIPNVTREERQIMLDCAKILTEFVNESPVYQPSTHSSGVEGGRPGDIFNSRTTIQELINGDGWTFKGHARALPDGTVPEIWTRPGKKKGVSATVYDNKIHVFTTNAYPLESRFTYDPFSYVTVLQYSGNFSLAAQELSQKGFSVSNGKQQKAKGGKGMQKGAEVCESGLEGSERGKTVSNEPPLAWLVEQFLETYSGTFHVSEIDREFGLVSRADKNNRSRVLNKLLKNYKIKKVAGKIGTWKTVDGRAVPMKLGAKKVTPLEISMPLGISEMAQILPGNIILVAGAPNGGKTAFLLTALYTLLKNIKNNKDKYNNYYNGPINGNYPAPSEGGVSVSDLAGAGVRYLNSEMDEMELTDRCATFPNGLEVFSEGCEFVQRYRDFADVIIPNGINFIDFLEIHEDFFELGKLIGEIFENLTTGICFIAVQKKQDADYAKGGAASLEKPRLVVNLDKNEGFGMKCKIVKCKKAVKPGDNHDGKEVDFDIDKNMNFLRYSTWRYVNEKQRKLINRDYENHGMEPLPEKEYAFTFRLKNGEVGRVLEYQVERWEKSYPGENVRAELERLEEDSRRKPFLNGKGWFYQIPNLLEKAFRI